MQVWSAIMRAFTGLRAVLRECERALLDHRRGPLLAVLGITRRVKIVDAVEQYVAHLKAICRPGSSHPKVRRSILGKWIASLGHVECMDEVRPGHVQQRIDALVLSGAAKWTIRNEFAAMHGFLMWAVSIEMIATNVAAKLKKPTVPVGNPDALPPEWISLIVSAFEGLGHLAVAVALAVLAGIRRSEVCRLAWQDVDFSGRMLTVRAEVSKTGHERHVPISPRLLSILREAYRERGTMPFVIRGKRANGSADPDKLGKAVVRILRPFVLKRISIDRAAFNGEKMLATGATIALVKYAGDIGMQLLRATWETALLDQGVPPQQVATWAGHSVAVQQRHYAHRDGTRHREAIDRLAM